MPFDTTNFDYTKVTPIYDKDNPPKRMSEAIRMAVADVEAQVRSGVDYDWLECDQCTAGAVCRRIEPEWNNSGEHNWYFTTWNIGPWGPVLKALSYLTSPEEMHPLWEAWDEWPDGFNKEPCHLDKSTFVFADDPIEWKADMLALADRLEAEGS